MGLRDLVTGLNACAAPGSSSSNPLSTLADAFLGGYSPKSEGSKGLSATAVIMKASLGLFKDFPLSTVPGDHNEFELDQGSIRNMKATDFVNGYHGDASGEKFQTTILSPEPRGIEPHFQGSEQIDSTKSMNFMPKVDGSPEMDVLSLHQSSYQPYNVWAHESKEYFQTLLNRSMDLIDASYDNEMRSPRLMPHPQCLLNRSFRFIQQQGANISFCDFKLAEFAKGQIGGTDITNMVVLAQSHTLEQASAHDDHPEFQGIDRQVMSDDEFSGGWLSLLGIALSHLGGLSQPRFLAEPIKWHEQVTGHRVWIEVEGLQQRAGWSVKLEATRKSLFDAIQDAAMLAVITMRLHFPCEFRGTPFTVLPMVPGQRSELDYPSLSNSAIAARFMGINYDDVATLHRERVASFHRERWESMQPLEEYVLMIQQSIAEVERLIEDPSVPERKARLEEIQKMKRNTEANVIMRDCGWSVFVSNEVQQQQVEPSHQEETPPTTASSPAASVRARL
ncbi:unnamed protein product [Alopecurus aequalis]